MLRADWKTGLFDCCVDAGSCMEALCLTPCVLGSQLERQSHPLQENAGCCTSYGAMMTLAVCCCAEIPLYVGGLVARSQARDRYGIPEDCCSSFCKVLCCLPCSIAQVTREMALNHEHPNTMCARRADGRTASRSVEYMMQSPLPSYPAAMPVAGYPMAQPVYFMQGASLPDHRSLL